jgi:hypothetical protein
MRTKTVLLSALLGAIGAVAVNAQSVYSLNAVGYINITAYPGYNIVSCPLIASPDNTLNTLLPPGTGQFKHWQVYTFNPTTNPQAVQDIGVGAVWGNGGAETINPGQAVWLYNPSNVSYTITFVGTVPTGPTNVTLYANSFNLVSSVVPASGDIITNSLMLFSNAVKHDQVYVYNALTSNSVQYIATGNSLATNWPAGDPILPTVGGGLFYFNSATTNNVWTENYSVANP